jgi:hypothetical protein
MFYPKKGGFYIKIHIVSSRIYFLWAAYKI